MMFLDVMHMLLLGAFWLACRPLQTDTDAQTGLIRRYFKEILLDTDVLNKARLSVFNSVFATATFPTWVGRPPTELGLPAGGTPKADQWRCVAEGLPVALYEAFRPVWNTPIPDCRKAPKTKTTDDPIMLQSNDDAPTIGAHGPGLANVAAALGPDAPPTSWTFPPAEGDEIPEEGEDDTDDAPADAGPDWQPATFGEVYVHMLPMVASVEDALARTTDQHRIDAMHDGFVAFGRSLVNDFGRWTIVTNIHNTLHLKEQFEQVGPGGLLNAFADERWNGELLKQNTNNHHGGQAEKTMLRGWTEAGQLEARIEKHVEACPDDVALFAELNRAGEDFRGSFQVDDEARIELQRDPSGRQVAVHGCRKSDADAL